MAKLLATPHLMMQQLDNARIPYSIDYNFLGFPMRLGAEVLSHCEQWVEVKSEHQKGSEYINLRHLARLRINML